MNRILFYGSPESSVRPRYLNKSFGETGKGVYLATGRQLAMLYGARGKNEGYYHTFEVDTQRKKTLNLTSSNYCHLHWIAVLLKENTIPDGIASKATKYIMEHFSVEYEQCDIIISYCSEFILQQFLYEFLCGHISYNQLNDAIKVISRGNLIYNIKSYSIIQKMVLHPANEFLNKGSKPFAVLSQHNNFASSEDISAIRKSIERNTTKHLAFLKAKNKNAHEKALFMEDIVQRKLTDTLSINSSAGVNLDEAERSYFAAKTLKRMRIKNGFSQAQLAHMSGLSKRSIQLYEEGYKNINKANGEHLYALSKVFDCKMEDLLENKDTLFSSLEGRHAKRRQQPK